MNDKELKLIAARIKDEQANISSLLTELENRSIIVKIGGSSKIPINGNDSFMLRAIGSVLHDFYVAVENIFEMIGREIDEYLPEGPDWHIQLLRQMALDVAGVRPAVISRGTLLLLDKYRSFRHVFRNVYGFSLEATRLKSLVEDLTDTALHLRQELEQFLNDLKNIVG